MFPSGMSFLTTKKGITFRCIWKAAKNCWSRKVSTLVPKCEQNLGVMSAVDRLRSLRRGFVHTSAPMSRLCDSILFCIRQHQASGTVISFWYVFSDYKGGDDISWLVTVRVTSSSVNERITPVIHIDDISSHPSPSSSLWCVFSDYQRMSTQSLCPCCSSFFATCRYGKARIRKCSKTLCLLLRKAQRRGTLPKRLQDTGCLVDIGLAQTVVSETQHFLDHC